MTAATSPNDSASPSEPHAAATSGTGPVGSKADSPSSSTRNSSPEPATEQGTEDADDRGETYAIRFKTDLARSLFSLREERGWSVYDLELRTGVSRSTLSRIERAVTEPTVTVLVKVCLAYGCPVSHLLAEVESQLLGHSSVFVTPPGQSAT
ncbi:helix-turn-helix transcriptional regulator [Streptomyces sp. NBC_01275]|uniref:helix-turn-helix domain-containing protein n=1 Tax=Streptomyces sp. NBC_01275 TaxID=2903807 RepID=UPI00224FFA5F|nr:helix-turn-helix transcriptional regulator [Streptomyces sp. NBC_01275]MCX4761916.1 helix-turn-helix transcriptional regulator [Streptomyces sp. NBC_01275]